MRTGHHSDFHFNRKTYTIAVLLLALVSSASSYPTSFDPIEMVNKEGDTVILGVISPDGLVFANPNKNETDIYLWKQASGHFEYSSSLIAHKGEVQTLDINNDHTLIVTGSADETAILWVYNPVSGSYDNKVVFDDPKSVVSVVRINAQGSIIAVGNKQQDVYVYQKGDTDYTLLQTLPNDGPTIALAIDDKNGAIVYSTNTGSQTQMYTYDKDAKQYKFAQNFTNEVYSADWSSDGLTLFLGHNKVVEVYSYQVDDAKYLQTAKLQDAQDNVVSVDVSGANNEWLAFASVDKFVYIHKLDGAEYKFFAKKNYPGEVAQHISFSDDGTLLAATFQTKALVYQYGIDCSGDKHSTKSRSTNVSCECDGYFVWDATNERCSVDCTKDPYSNGTASSFERCWCVDRFLWSADTYQCEIDCASDPFSTKVNNSTSSCVCLPKYAWNKTVFLCYVDCANIRRGTHANINASDCECVPQYTWKDMDCYFDCTKDPHSNGTNKDLDVDACYCNKGYVWNTTQKQCDPFVDCTADPFSTGENINPTTCKCKDKFRWNATSVLCYFNCELDPRSTGKNINAGDCQCRNPYIWDMTSRQCEVDCAIDPNSNGTNTNATACFCNQNYTWSSARGECVFWFDCSKDPNSNGITLDNRSCECKTNFHWNDSNHLCIVTCSSDANSNGQAADTTTCLCNEGYSWSVDTKQCQSSASSQTTIVVVLAVATGLLAILSIYLIIRIVKLKRRNNASLIMSADVDRQDDDT